MFAQYYAQHVNENLLVSAVYSCIIHYEIELGSYEKSAKM